MARTTTRTRTTQQSANQVHPDFASVESTDGVTFSHGVMMVNGAAQRPVEVEKWEATNGLTEYTTVMWEDPATGDRRVSCNCVGWAMKKPGKPRRCKHTDDMMGVATCDAAKVTTSGPIQIRTVAEAERQIPKLHGRELRGIMLD